MANIKSAKKSIKQDKKRTVKNNDILAKTKNTLKRINKKIDSGENVSEGQKKFIKYIDKASTSGLVHKNKKARLKSRLAKRMSKEEKK